MDPKQKLEEAAFCLRCDKSVSCGKDCQTRHAEAAFLAGELFREGNIEARDLLTEGLRNDVVPLLYRAVIFGILIEMEERASATAPVMDEATQKTMEDFQAKTGGAMIERARSFVALRRSTATC